MTIGNAGCSSNLLFALRALNQTMRRIDKLRKPANGNEVQSCLRFGTYLSEAPICKIFISFEPPRYGCVPKLLLECDQLFEPSIPTVLKVFWHGVTADIGCTSVKNEACIAQLLLFPVIEGGLLSIAFLFVLLPTIRHPTSQSLEKQKSVSKETKEQSEHEATTKLTRLSAYSLGTKQSPNSSLYSRSICNRASHLQYRNKNGEVVSAVHCRAIAQDSLPAF